MASLESSDVIQGSTASENINGDATVTRVFLLKNVSGTGSQIPLNAISDGNIPALGDPHPDNDTIFVSGKSAKPVAKSPDLWEVTVTYAVPDLGSQVVDTGSIASFAASLTSAQTTKDKDDNPLTVGTLSKTDPENLSDGTIHKQTALVEILVPQFAIRAQRKQTFSPVTYKDIVGKLNSGSVTIDGTSYSNRTLLCTSIQGETRDNGESYNCTFEFQFRDDWDVEVTAIDPDTGAPYEGITDITDGTKKYSVYPDTSFGGLDL